MWGASAPHVLTGTPTTSWGYIAMEAWPYTRGHEVGISINRERYNAPFREFFKVVVTSSTAMPSPHGRTPEDRDNSDLGGLG